MKIGFDDETSPADINNLEQHLIQLRNPASITLRLKPPPSLSGTTDSDLNLYPGASLQKKVSSWRESKKCERVWFKGQGSNWVFSSAGWKFFKLADAATA